MDAYNSYTYFAVSSPAPYVAHVEINRPSKLNAFNNDMWREYSIIFETLSIDPSIRSIVLSAAGDRAFCAGLDLSSSAELTSSDNSVDPARKFFALKRYIHEFQDAIGSVTRCEKPVIVAIHGISFGLAIDIVCCADVRLCAADTKFSVKEVDIGIAADIGTLTRLPKIVGSLSWVKDIALTARIFGAAEAERHGFVSAVHESKAATVAAALKLAVLMAEKSPLGVAGTKALIDYSVDHSTEQALEYTRIWNGAAIQAPDPAEAIRATFAKEKGVYAKL